MIQLSTVVFSLMIELIVVLMLVLSMWLFFSLRRNKKDRKSAAQLVEQIKHQSELRLSETGSFLQEKYQFEGEELEKAIQSIDRAEKKFMQNLINMYLQRDSDRLLKIDASLAELIEAYKELTPATLAAENGDEVAIETEDENTAELEELRASNARLSEELAITKQTMGNMIAEFGNMFGGGQDTKLETEEVLEKVNVSTSEGEVEKVEGAPALQEEVVGESSVTAEPATDEAAAIKPESEPASQPAAENKKQAAADHEDLIDFHEGIDELMDGIDLSED